MLLQSGCDVDAISINVVAGHNHITNVYGDTQGDRAELGAFRNLSTPYGFLDLPRPLDGVKRAGEHCENTVSGRLDHPAVVSLGARTDYIAK